MKLKGLITEYSVKNKNNDSIPVYSVTNTEGFCTEYFNKEVASENKTTYKKVPCGYFAYNPSRINVGSIDIQRKEDVVIVSPLYVVFSVSEKINPDYLLYYLKSTIGTQKIKAVATGSVRDNLKFSMLEEFDIPLPNIKEQNKIVQLLDSINNTIQKTNKRPTLYDELIKSRFIELFGATSAKNCTKQIKDYAEVLGGYAFKSDLFCADAIPVIRISNINNGCVELDYNICFDELFWEQNKRFRVEQNDVLMAMSGATTGKAGIYRENMPALVNQRVACIRAKDGVACPTFLFVATQLEWMYDLIQETSAGCAQPNISGKQIENMPVPDASYEQQQQFATFVEQTDKSKLATTKTLKYLEELKHSLMNKYFGEEIDDEI